MLLLAALLMSGCSNEPPTTEQKENKPGSIAEAGVIINRSFDFGRGASIPFGVLREPEKVEAFRLAFESAELLPGIANVTEPDFEIIIQNDKGEGQSYYLWLPLRYDSEKQKKLQGIMMLTTNTHERYSLSLEATKHLSSMMMRMIYSREQAMRNGDVMKVNDEILETEAWLDFADAVSRGENAAVQLTSYTKEGDPIFENLFYRNGSIRYSQDSTYDSFGSGGKISLTCNALLKKNTGEEVEYTLGGCGDPKGETSFVLRVKE
ncbi:protein of unknown function [Paenibacillaceae bacterium GAS479]|nr:protein of unknown function [Paenibacillaceae bacterium GAS479]